ncbi:MAG: type II toxin-antitoxin system PemK/MazF family toxin [DPANN group archaeon]|nr:type II toxin-antitoxin system PemK/MazF family toxin [DPANN group archaeon]
MRVRRGQIILVGLDPVIGAEQGKTRPALVIQNDTGNRFSPITIIAPITSKVFSKQYPTNVTISSKASGLKMKSTIMLNQIRAIDNSRIKKEIRMLDRYTMGLVDEAIKESLGLS